MSALTNLLDSFRQAAVTEREKGTYFEELMRCYLKTEPYYHDLYADVWSYREWAQSHNLPGNDAGIDLVAETNDSHEFHAIQCKFYDADRCIQKQDIDSFFTASGKAPFTDRIIVTTTNCWGKNAEEALCGQQIPVSRIDLNTLEQSEIDWSRYQPGAEPVRKERKTLRPHQQEALDKVCAGLSSADRGKLIMACGSGKTFTSLKIAEQLAGPGKMVLFLVPSLALLSQTLTEWTQQSAIPLHSFAVCSDSQVGKKRDSNDDTFQLYIHELNYPATTEPNKLAHKVAIRHDQNHMMVIFSTYHSIDIISQAQQKFGLGEFALVVCDEAHRTTGATALGKEESYFVKVHNNQFIRGAKRLYMTATPRLYSEAVKNSAANDGITLSSMDDREKYGRTLHTLNFSKAVALGLLVDYKVIVLAMDESHVSRRLQKLLRDPNNQLKIDDAAKIIGCWKALTKQDLTSDLVDDLRPMQRAVAFCEVIERSANAKSHRVSSKEITDMFQQVVEEYQKNSPDGLELSQLRCEAKHVDGGMNASAKGDKLAWLKDEPPANSCRILSNVRCLSEGVDVPALDAILFLSPRKSQVDVVQSVGRVMRTAPGKRRGYVILPVVLPAGVETNIALNDNKSYKVVWQVLQALRAHDDRFDATVNKFELSGFDSSKIEVKAIIDQLNLAGPRPKNYAIGAELDDGEPLGPELEFDPGVIEKAIYAKIVQKVGRRLYWDEWVGDIAKIANTYIDRIQGILENPANQHERQLFNMFAAELRDDLNDSIQDSEVIELLAQHLITKPVFDALFTDHNFSQQNPVSRAIEEVSSALQQHQLEKESDTLRAFYESVKMRASGIDSATGKQKIMIELYEKFFRNAFPKMSDRLGIVYTPPELVDFILHSSAEILQKEFGQSLGDKGVHILDPFTGTGTFIARLIQSGLIPSEQLRDKYQHEIHANEIALLAYYIATVNIEAAYQQIVGGVEYQPFKGICLTDTFQLWEKDDLIEELLVDNSARRKEQKQVELEVIISNPPYSAGQKSENDNNQNLRYPSLDQRIAESYAAQSTASLKKTLYDSYIRAIRWASDRVTKGGVIGLVVNAGCIDGTAAAGLRLALAQEFSSIYIFHLRGNLRTVGELARREGGHVFASGTRIPVTILLLVNNPQTSKPAKIYFHDIGDYLSREEKLAKVVELHSIGGITALNGWQTILPNTQGDWLEQRDSGFANYIPLGGKKDDKGSALFSNYSCGVITSRDAWCYNLSHRHLERNMQLMIDFYNDETARFIRAFSGASKEEQAAALVKFINNDPQRISWSFNVKRELLRGNYLATDGQCLVQSLYRPFCKQWLYYDRCLNERVYQMPQIFPNPQAANLAICVSGAGAKEFSVLMVDILPDFQHIFNGQCFPLYLYPKAKDGAPRKRISAITDHGLEQFRKQYPGEEIGAEEIFYYSYGLLHCPDYRERYGNNLTKELPRIPLVKGLAEFRQFIAAGRKLAELHINYEKVDPYPAEIEGEESDMPASAYRVTKMKYARLGKEKDRSTIIYNHKITVRGIPLEAHDYQLNGQSVIDLVIKRQAVTVDKASGIENDANLWASEVMHNPRYPLELLLRVVTVSLETQKIIKGLPGLDI